MRGRGADAHSWRSAACCPLQLSPQPAWHPGREAERSRWPGLRGAGLPAEADPGGPESTGIETPPRKPDRPPSRGGAVPGQRIEAPRVGRRLLTQGADAKEVAGRHRARPFLPPCTIQRPRSSVCPSTPAGWAPPPATPGTWLPLCRSPPAPNAGNEFVTPQVGVTVKDCSFGRPQRQS